MATLARTLGLLLLVWSAVASAEIYRWVDAEGRLHFSERLDQVPPAQRRAARERAREAGPSPVQTYELPGADGAARRASPRGRVLAIPFQRHGGLMQVSAVVNDVLSVSFYVDTGASGVSLPGGVAERLGIAIDADTPRTFVRTANGIVERPLVELSSVDLGGARVEGLKATVNPSLDVGLLGGDFFNNFVYGVDAAAGMISLVPNEGVRGGLDEAGWRARFRSLREPLAELEAYLAETQVSRPGRRAELEARRESLRAELRELERAAQQAGVPVAWRQ